MNCTLINYIIIIIIIVFYLLVCWPNANIIVNRCAINITDVHGFEMEWNRESKSFDIRNDGFREGSEIYLLFEGRHKKSNGKEIIFLDDILISGGPCPGIKYKSWHRSVSKNI